jgi:hypothetical protein
MSQLNLGPFVKLSDVSPCPESCLASRCMIRVRLTLEGVRLGATEGLLVGTTVGPLVGFVVGN